MSISYQVLGNPGQDNALFVRVDNGQAVYRLLFDCGEGCPTALPFGEILALDHLLFSHMHMDHISGFDSLFRATFNRPNKPMHVWGPPDNSRILHHRFRGFQWNLHADQPGQWYVHDLHQDNIVSFRFDASDAFASAHVVSSLPYIHRIVDSETFTIEAAQMHHGTPSMAYIVREKPRINVDVTRLSALGLRPGPWLQQLKASHTEDQTPPASDGRTYDWQQLRDLLLIETPGDSVAYLTDFALDEHARRILLPLLEGCATVICESQYREADADLAQRNYHMTATQAATLARDAHVEELILFHVSNRYPRIEWWQLLEEARTIFANTNFASHWQPPIQQTD